MFDAVHIANNDTESRPFGDEHEKAARTIRQIRSAMAAAKAPLSETEIWQLLAQHSSVLWRDAHGRMIAAQGVLDDHMLPENKPIGAIGIALDGGTTDMLEEGLACAIADFVMIDEHLRSDAELMAMMDVLAEECRMLDASQRISEDVLRLTEELDVPQKASGLLGRTFRVFSGKKA